MEGSMRRKSSVSPKEAHARDRVIRTAIGRMLSMQYGLAQPLPERLKHLLKRLDSPDESAAVELRSNSPPQAA
jgi:hypothetical protein